MKRAVIYSRVSTLDQNPQMQLLDLQQLALQRGFEVIETYVDHGYSGVRVKRPALDRMLDDARRGRFDILLFGAATVSHAPPGICSMCSTI